MSNLSRPISIREKIKAFSYWKEQRSGTFSHATDCRVVRCVKNTTPSCLLSSTQKRSCCSLLLVQCHDTWITFFFGVFLVSGITFIGIIFLCFFLFIIFAILFWNKKKLTDSNLSCLSYRCANNLNNAISGWFSSFYWPVGEVNTYSCLVRANSLIERESCRVWNLYLFQCMNRKQLNNLSL